jgi:hypothetical protein
VDIPSYAAEAVVVLAGLCFGIMWTDYDSTSGRIVSNAKTIDLSIGCCI